MNPLLWPSPGRWLDYLGAAAAAVAAYGMWASHQRDIGRQEVRAEWAAEKVAQHAAALAQSQANAKETVRRIDRQTEAQNAHDHEIASARAAAAGADAAASRLRDDLARFTASHRTTGNPTTSGNGSPADTAVPLLANLLDRLERDGRGLAAGLDAARAAGLQCERAYLALMPP